MQKMLNGKIVDLTDSEVVELNLQSEYYVQTFAATETRNKRDRLLSDTDWMALSDNTMTPEWATYRQALRDITDQTGFPNNVTWPSEPS